MAADAAAFMLAASAVAAPAVERGGYEAPLWGWGSLCALAVVCCALVLGVRPALCRGGLAMVGMLAALLVWTAVTATRPGAATQAVPELERTVFYAASVLAGLVVVCRGRTAAFIAGLTVGIVGVSIAGLVMLLLLPGPGVPDAYEGRLLSAPIGYANALGILAAIGAVFAFGGAAYARRRNVRAAAAGSLVPLLSALAFTSSRGAVAALGLALGLFLLLDPLRGRLASTAIVALPLPLLAVWLGSRSNVTNAWAQPDVVARDGRAVAASITLLTVASFLVAYAALGHERRVPDALVWVLLLLACVGVGVALSRGGDGVLGDRPAYWHAAWSDYRAHPLLGSGAGSFAEAWLRYRTSPVSVQHAHNLYLETLAELGPAGLLLLVGALVTPIVATLRSARTPLAVTACAAYTAFLAHGAIDWDWEIPAVAVVGLLTGVASIAAASGALRARRAAPKATLLYVAAAALLAVVSTVGLVGNRDLDAAGRAADSGSWAAAADLARGASRWVPWSARPYLLLGVAETARGDRTQARAAFRRATELDPRDWRAWYELGRVSDSPDVQQHALEQIMQLNPLAVRPG